MKDRKPIEAISIPYGEYGCEVYEVRELEKYTADLEKKLEIAVELLTKIRKDRGEMDKVQCHIAHIPNTLNQLKDKGE